MSIDNTYPTYDSLDHALKQQSVALTAAEMHGLISGLLCGGNRDGSWLTLVHDLTNEGMAYPHTLADLLQQLRKVTADTLEDDSFEFKMLMPDDEKPVFERADALAGWVNHFLLSLAMKKRKIRSNWPRRLKKWSNTSASPRFYALVNSATAIHLPRKIHAHCIKFFIYGFIIMN